MTGKADAVRAVSQQFKDRTNTVIEGVMAHLRDDNAREILGPGLSPLIGRGSLKSIVTFALYADVLRMVRDMVMADGEISDEEVQESLGLLSVLAAGFAKVRKEYALFAQLTPANARQFLSQYEADAGLFGQANEATKWAGVELCRHIQSDCGDSGPINAFGASIVGWAEILTHSGQVAGSQLDVLTSIRHRVSTTNDKAESLEDAEPAQGKVLTSEVAKAFLDDETAVDLSHFDAIEDSAAEMLSTHKGYLCLSSLVALSEASARWLGDHEGELNLSSLTKLPIAIVRQLCKHRGTLQLDGICHLDSEQANVLAMHVGCLSLEGVTHLTDESAFALAGHRGRLVLEGLRFLSTEAAEHLRKRGKSDTIDYDNLLPDFTNMQGVLDYFGDIRALLRESTPSPAGGEDEIDEGELL